MDAGRVRIRAARIWGWEYQERKGCSGKGWSVLVSVCRLPGVRLGLDCKKVSGALQEAGDGRPGARTGGGHGGGEGAQRQPALA